CNDVIKKPKLDSHRGQCRGAYFTCIDCNTTFSGNDHKTHTSCISEAQKYQGALYKPEK
ncbi:LYAR-type C2HC zinc finger-domain-containing protein, partial [Morchella snyderi]